MNENKKISIFLDASKLDSLQTCAFQFKLRHEMNKIPQHKAEALDRGDLMHYAKEGYYNTLKSGKPWEAAVDAGLVSLRVRAAEESELANSEIEALLKAFQENVTFWRVWDLSIKIEAIEEAFSYTLYEDEQFRFVMTGKIDLLFSDNRYEKCPMDTKTYSRDFPLRRSTNQFMNYAFATSSNYLFVDRVGLQTSIPMDKRHKRVPMSYEPEILNEWKQDTIKWFMYYYDYHLDNSWPKNRTSCDKFGRLCEYHDPICDTSGEKNKIYNLEQHFKDTEPWDVTRPHGKERKHD